MSFNRETRDQIAAVILRTGTPEQQAKALEYLARGEVDDAVYACRQRGDDSTYAIVNEAISRFLERTGQYVTNDATREAALSVEREICAGMAENYDLGTVEGHAIAACIRKRNAP